MNKASMFYHDMRHLLKNKDAHIMVNDSQSPIPQVKEKKKWYTARNIKSAYFERQLQHITGQPINWILYAVNNKILHNLPILREDVGIAEDTYGPIIPHITVKTVRRII